MAHGIAEINGWEEALGNYPALNTHDIYWETENSSSLSEWSCDHKGPCCACDCDCQPTTKDSMVLDGHTRASQNKPGFVYSTSLYGHQYGRGKFNPHPNDLVGADFLYEEQDILSAEDIFYYNAKQQRHLNDAQKRIQDWIRVIPELVGNDRKPSTYHNSKRGYGRNSKEGKRQAANKSEKDKRQGRDGKRKERGKPRR